MNRRLAGSVKDNRVYRNAFIDVKSKDHHLVVSRINLKLTSRKGNYLLGNYEVGRLQDENLREQLNTIFESLRVDSVEDG